MQRFKTLSHNDAEFRSYLDGSFSETHRALPVRSLNVETASEQVTFEIVPLSEIRRPSTSKIIWALMRPQSLVFAAGPMLTILFFCMAHRLDIQWLLAIGSFIGVIAFQVAVALLNDANDHIKGRDRLLPHGGSRVIQRGWVTALSVRQAAWGLMGLAILFGLPALFYGPAFIVALVAAVVGLELAFQKFKLKARGWSEILAFLLTGPLLTAGYAWAITGQIVWKAGALGCVFGAISLMYYHSVNFENIMPDSQAGVRTWATRTGFDLSKNFFYFTAFASFIAIAGYALVIEREVRLLPAVLAQALFLVPVCTRVRHLASPLSSNLVGLRNESVRLCWITSIALLGGYLWALASGIVLSESLLPELGARLGP